MSGVCLEVGRPKGVTVHAKDGMFFPSKGRRVWFIYVKHLSGRSVLWHCCSEVNREHVNTAGLILPETSVVFNPIAWAISLSLEREKLTVVIRSMPVFFFPETLSKCIKFSCSLFITLIPARFIYFRNSILSEAIQNYEIGFGSILYLDVICIWLFAFQTFEPLG